MIKKIVRPAVCTAALLATSSLSFGAALTNIVSAARAGDANQVRAFVQKKADVNTRAADGATALHWAVNRDDLKMVEMLIAAGANVDVTNDFGTTPLWLACENGSAAVAEKLLKAGAKPNLAVSGGETPLMIAARTGSVGTVRVLLDNGANVNAKEDTQGQTALLWAMQEKHPDVVKLLIDRGADIRVKTKGGFSPFLLALRNGDVELAKSFLDKGGIEVNDKVPGSQGNALLVGIANSNPAVVTFLLDKGADVNQGAGAALAAAIGAGNYDIAALLVNRGANVNLGRTANGGVLRSLIKNNGGGPAPAAIDAENEDADAGVKVSSKIDRIGLAAMLVAKGADVNSRGGTPPRGKTASIGTAYRALPPLEHPDNSGGETVLMAAAENLDVPMIKFLLQAGADPKLTSGGDNALMLAAGVGNSPSSPGDNNPNVLAAVKALYETGAYDLNAKDDNGDTAIHGTVLRGADAALRFLAEKGADIDAPNRVGWTPLIQATGLRPGTPNYRPTHTALVLRELLAAKGIKANEFGETPKYVTTK